MLLRGASLPRIDPELLHNTVDIVGPNERADGFQLKRGKCAMLTDGNVSPPLIVPVTVYDCGAPDSPVFVPLLASIVPALP